MHVNSPPLELLNPVVKSAITIPAIIRCHALGHAGTTILRENCMQFHRLWANQKDRITGNGFLGGWTIVLIFTIAIVMIARYPVQSDENLNLRFL
jgi:hypothetical protein